MTSTSSTGPAVSSRLCTAISDTHYLMPNTLCSHKTCDRTMAELNASHPGGHLIVSGNPSHAFAVSHLHPDHEVLLMLDANEALDSGKSRGIQCLVETCGMFDLQADDPAPSTYQPADLRRIDFMFGTAGIKRALRASGTLSFTEGLSSDPIGHCLSI
jgi:hypothetical protein